MKRFILSLTLALSILLNGCRKEPNDGTAPAAHKSAVLTVYTVNYPLKYFAERIGGDHVKVYFPAPADEDPAYWTPDAETVLKYQQADLILLNGAGYAKWVDKVSLPATKFVNTSSAFADRYITLEEAVTHSHVPGGKHEHGSVAFTTWLDPSLAIEQAQAISGALAKKQPQHSQTFKQNLASLEKDLQGLDQKLVALSTEGESVPLIFSHPVYQYLTRAYGISAISVHWEPGEAPTPEMWATLKAQLTQHPAKWMIWEGAPMQESVNQLKTLGISSVTFSPCGAPPEQGDYLSVMRENLLQFEQVFK
ncbi:metal ABC transporter substrate-binding protein [Planctomycetota bacterium]